jgi:hypothetical protein
MEAGDDGGVKDGGDGGTPPGPPVCNPAKGGWAPSGDGIDPSIASSGFGQFGGVSRDELTVAWTTPSGQIQVADRPTKIADFGAPMTVSAGNIALANDRVALDFTGTLVLAVSADRSQLVEIGRDPGGTTWTAENPTDLAQVNALSTNGGGALSQPVFGGDGKTLFFLWAAPNKPPGLVAAVFNAQLHLWEPSGTAMNPELASTDATHRRRPTGASSDGRTLFFYDEVMGKERAAWRDSITSPFTQFADVGPIPEAAPNYMCNRLYFQGTDPDAGGAGLDYAY